MPLPTGRLRLSSGDGRPPAAASAGCLCALCPAPLASPPVRRHLRAVVGARLEAADALVAAAAGAALPQPALATEALSFLLELGHMLQALDTEATTHAAFTHHAAPAAAQLYQAVVHAILSVASAPGVGAAIEACRGGHAARAVQELLELLFSQMMSSGIRCMGSDPCLLLEAASGCGLWAAVHALLGAAPTCGLRALLALASPGGTCLLASSLLLRKGDTHAATMRGAANALLGEALEYLAAQAPLLADRLHPRRLAVALNERLGSLGSELDGGAPGSQAWEAVWSPVRRGVQALAAELIRAGGPALYAAWRDCLPAYDGPGERPPLLRAMQLEWGRMQEEGRREPLEARLQRILVKCVHRATERAGLVELQDFMAGHGQFSVCYAAQCSGDAGPFGSMLAALMRAAGQARQPRMHGPAAQQTTLHVALPQAALPHAPTAQDSPAPAAERQAAQEAAPSDHANPRGELQQARVPLAPTIPRDSNVAAAPSTASPAASKAGEAGAQQAPARQADQPGRSAAPSGGHPQLQQAQPSRGQEPRVSRLRLPTRWAG